MALPLLINAAGYGSRLFPITIAIPKELFPIGNKPALHLLLEEALLANIKEVICITSPRKEALTTYLSYNEDFNFIPFNESEKSRLKVLSDLNKKFSYKFGVQEIPIGVGDSMNRARKFINTDFFFMLHPDDLLKEIKFGLTKMKELFEKYRCPIIAVEEVPNERIHLYGAISCKKIDDEDDEVYEVEEIVEKPKNEIAPSNFGVVGRYLLPKKIFNIFDEQKTDSPCFISGLNTIAKRDRIVAYVLKTKRYDIGNVAGWKNALSDLA
jgi:UTP--glucose-1-phosphate uridylyltransferase